MAQIGMTRTFRGSLETIKPRVMEALKAQGFGILTEIDLQKTLREKIGAEIEPYLILGACNPKFANQAISSDRSLGLLLPCNVVLREVGGHVEVSIQDPEVMFSVVDTTDAALQTLPEEVKSHLQAALQAVAQQ